MIISSYISACVQAMGWVLLHSLWQIALVLMTVALLFKLISAKEAQIRYRISLAAFVFLIMVSGGTFSQYWKVSNSNSVQEIQFSTAAEFIPLETIGEASFSLPAETELSIKDQFQQLFLTYVWLVVGIWFVGICLLSLRHIGGWLHIRKISRTGGVPDSRFYEQLISLQAKLGIKRKVKLVESLQIGVPITFGWVKPVILFPTQLLTGLSEAQIQLLLIHELAHIRRADYLINLGVLALKTIFFYHPGIYLLANWMDQSREACCDDMVVAKQDNRALYAKTLIFLQREQLSSPIALGALGQKGTFPTRLKRLFEEKPLPSRAGWPMMLLAGLMMSVLFIAFQPRIVENSKLLASTHPLSDSISMQMKYPGVYEVINAGTDPFYLYVLTEKAGDVEWQLLAQDMEALGVEFQVERVETSIRFSASSGEKGMSGYGQFGAKGMGAFFYYPKKNPGESIVFMAVDTIKYLHNGVFTNMTHGRWLKECIRRYDLTEVDSEPVRENKLGAHRPKTFKQLMMEAMGKDSILFVINGEQFVGTDAHRVQQALVIPDDSIAERGYCGACRNRLRIDFDRSDAHTYFSIETKAYRKIESLREMYADGETGFLLNGHPMELWGYTPVQFFDLIPVEDFLEVTVSKGKTVADNLGFPARHSVISIVIEPDHPLLKRELTSRQLPEFLSVFPNPTQNIATIDITISAPDRLQMQIIDMKGNILWESRPIEYQPGHYQIPVALREYSVGYYLIRVLTRQGVMQGIIERFE